ncbi:MAG TPA: threonine synthase [Thermoplasmata archaeon]|nr:threonine synthase [Thermoplasmata archaeon]
MGTTGSRLTHLECRSCCAQVDPDRPVGVCPTCGHALFAGYRTDGWDPGPWRAEWPHRVASLWRYRELLPVRRTEDIVTLGEGFSPIVPLVSGADGGGPATSLKDDGGLPTGSFKARGMAVAVSRARELGVRSLFVPSAGNAGVALAAYGARAGLAVRVYLPERTPQPMKDACRLYGAEVLELPGTLREVGAEARTREASSGAFDMSTLREPYRLEGKKTMGFEIFEQCAAEGLPDAILYPTGGGTGLVGMYKAFQELRALGQLEKFPRLYSVQPDGCAPVVRALREGAPRVTPWDHPSTIAPGLLVPAPFASERILEAVRESRGGGVTVSDAEIVDAVRDLARRFGVSASPEGAAPYAALPKLVRDDRIRSDERVLLYNTGTGLPFSLPELERAVGPGPSS